MLKENAQGFTLIEMMVTIALAAIALSLAVPSFSQILAKRRVEGVMSELVTDLQYARGEAVSRNVTVRVTFGTGCYVITAQPAGSTPSSSCTQSGASTIGTNAAELKTLQLSPGSSAALSPNSSLTYIEFDPVRGIATFSTAGTSGSINVNSNVTAAQLQAYVSTVGRVCLSSPSGISGYPASCP